MVAELNVIFVYFVNMFRKRGPKGCRVGKIVFQAYKWLIVRSLEASKNKAGFFPY